MTLLDACREVMADDEVQKRYRSVGGMTASDVLAEIHERHPGGFPLVSMLDVHDEMTKFFGRS